MALVTGTVEGLDPLRRGQHRVRLRAPPRGQRQRSGPFQVHPHCLRLPLRCSDARIRLDIHIPSPSGHSVDFPSFPSEAGHSSEKKRRTATSCEGLGGKWKFDPGVKNRRQMGWFVGEHAFGRMLPLAVICYADLDGCDRPATCALKSCRHQFCAHSGG